MSTAPRRQRIVVIDNYDSFTYNIVQYLGELGQELHIHRNDKITLDGIAALEPDKIVVSPGPCSPEQAGISVDAIKRFAGQVPLLGVCLGHQSIGHAFGGRVIRAGRLMHGKTSPVRHDSRGVFASMPNPFTAIRYHSLLIERDTLPECLEVTAETEQGEIMGVRHKTLPVEGIQFHPESVMTEQGMRILENFVKQ